MQTTIWKNLIAIAIVAACLAWIGGVKADGCETEDCRVDLGRLGGSEYDTESTSNEFSTYGSRFSTRSINNDFGEYGSEFSTKSPNNPYSTSGPRIYGE